LCWWAVLLEIQERLVFSISISIFSSIFFLLWRGRCSLTLFLRLIDAHGFPFRFLLLTYLGLLYVFLFILFYLLPPLYFCLCFVLYFLLDTRKFSFVLRFLFFASSLFHSNSHSNDPFSFF